MAVRTLPLDLELTVYAGTTFHREIRWRPDGVHLQDFTGWSALMLIGPPRGTAVEDLRTSDGSIELTAQGQILLTLSHTATAVLPEGVLTYILDLTAPNGVVTRFLRGRLTVIQDVRP